MDQTHHERAALARRSAMTQIEISIDTREKLRQIMAGDETYDQAIDAIIDAWEICRTQHLDDS